MTISPIFQPSVQSTAGVNPGALYAAMAMGMDPNLLAMASVPSFMNQTAWMPTPSVSALYPQVAIAPQIFGQVSPSAALAAYGANATPATVPAAALPVPDGSDTHQTDSSEKAGGTRSGSEIWAGVRDPRSVHLTQVSSKFNKSASSGNRDCGPASVAMALHLLGIKVRGERGSGQKVIDAARALTGVGERSSATTNLDLERALGASGASTQTLSSVSEVRSAVESGKPVILNGNPGAPGAYGKRFGSDKMVPFDGAHWIVVSGYDTEKDSFIINDPLSKAGAVKVSAKELRAYMGGSIGIEVSPA